MQIKMRHIKVVAFYDENDLLHYLAIDVASKQPLAGVVAVHTYEDGDGKLVAEVGLYTTDIELLDHVPSLEKGT